MEYTLDCSLERQDNLTQEERNKGVEYTKESYTIGNRWVTLKSESNQTHLNDKTRQEVGNRCMGTSKTREEMLNDSNRQTLDISAPDTYSFDYGGKKATDSLVGNMLAKCHSHMIHICFMLFAELNDFVQSPAFSPVTVQRGKFPMHQPTN